MGVPKFASWIYNNKTRKLTTSNIPQNVVSLSFDVNSIIHGCAQIIYNYGEWQNEQRNITISEMTDEQLEKELFKLTTDTILRIVQKVQPKTFLVLAVDGVAPLAKIQQQRCRRYRSASISSIQRFDPNCITPGTDFMFRLDEHFQKWIQETHSILPPKVLYSNHMVSGEGEQKIFDYIRNYEISGYGTHIIYGLDADLIILSLISRLKGIYLLREKSLDQNVFERLIDINEVRYYLEYRMNTETAIDDFALLTFFLGNDFIPTSPMFCGDMYDTIEYLLDTYVELGHCLTYPKYGTIDIRNFKKYLYFLKNTENKRLKEVYRNPPKLGFKTLDLSVHCSMLYGETRVSIDKEEFQRNWYTKIFSPHITQTDLAFQLPNSIYLNLFEPSRDKIEKLVKEYISGFLWTYLYYKKGTSAIHPNYYYTSGYAPLIQSVVEFFPQNIQSPYRKDINIDYSLTILQQLLAVLPPKSIHVMPKELHKFYQLDSPIIDMFPIKVEVDTEAKDMERLGVVRMSPVEPRRLLDVKIDISEERSKRYELQKNLIFERKEESQEIKVQKQQEEKEKQAKKDHETKNESIEAKEVSYVERKEGQHKPKFIQDFERLRKLRKV